MVRITRRPFSTGARLLCELAVAAVILLFPAPITLTTRLVTAVACSLLVGIFLFYTRIYQFSPQQLAQLYRPNPRKALLESLFYTCGSFGLLVYLAASKHASFHFVLGFLGIVCAWLMVQLIYSQQYALRYYYDNGGLNFPNCEQPDWTEFLYQGFCMAACYQTSDTSVTSSAMRRLITTHGLLSYILSVSIIATLFGLIGNLL